MYHRAPTTRRRAARRGTRALRLLTVLCTVVGLLALPAGAASAHDELIRTEPAADAVLDAPPSQVALEFSADLLAISPTIVLSGQSGQVPLDEPAVVGPRVSVPLPADLPEGDYTVIWRVVSGDGHPIQGSFGFSLSSTPAPPSASPSPTPTSSLPPLATPTGTPASTPAPSATTTSPAPAGTNGGAAVTAGLVVLAITVLSIALARRLRSRRG